ncbi:MAG: hypothetical protein Q4B32_05600 [Clostridia bacterium]|nr:hypothetical protein [Clostridia bacterium]
MNANWKLHICPHCGEGFFLLKKADGTPETFEDAELPEDGVIPCPYCKEEMRLEGEE